MDPVRDFGNVDMIHGDVRDDRSFRNTASLLPHSRFHSRIYHRRARKNYATTQTGVRKRPSRVEASTRHLHDVTWPHHAVVFRSPPFPLKRPF